MALFNRLRESDEKGFVTEVSIGPQSPQEKRLYEDKYGLTTSHAYSLVPALLSLAGGLLDQTH